MGVTMLEAVLDQGKDEYNKLTKMIVTWSGKGGDLIEKVRCSLKIKPRLRADWVVLTEELCILASYFLKSDEQEFTLGGV